VGGPLGGAIGVWVAPALGTAVAELIGERAQKFGEEAGKKLFDVGSDSLAERLKKKSVGLEAVYCEALRASLIEIQSRAGMGYEDWYANWNFCLGAPGRLKLPALDADDLTPQRLDELFRGTMENLDAQGEAVARKSSSLQLKTRILPGPLLDDLRRLLPERLTENFRVLLVQPEHEEAWKEAQAEFASYARITLANIDRKTDLLPQMAETGTATEKKVDRLTEIMEASFRLAEREGRITEQLKDKEAEIARLSNALLKLQEQVGERAVEPGEAKLADLLQAGDLTAAFALKTKQVEQGRAESARDLFELGTICELRFDWPNALDAYREAWRLNHNTEYGFKFAYIAQRQNRFSEAIALYEALLPRLTSHEQMARALNNLGLLYEATQRLREAEEAYGRSLFTYRTLAKSNPDGYLRYVATTLNNLAVLFQNTQRLREAEESYRESLVIRRRLAKSNPEVHLPYLAMVLNNLGNLYGTTQRLVKAEAAYRKSLSAYRGLATSNPAAYLPNVAITLNNLGNLYSNTQRLREAEKAYGESLSTYRKLAESNPEACLPHVARTLNNLGNHYSNTQRLREAEDAYGESLSTYRKLAELNPQAYRPDVAKTLNNVGNLYKDTQRPKRRRGRVRKPNRYYSHSGAPTRRRMETRWLEFSC
jgi:hypothetical protein